MKTALVRKLQRPTHRLLYWIVERESIRLKREAGKQPPWTDDEILRTYRFCNARRMDDNVSRWLLTNWYGPHFGHPNMLYAAALARFVNVPDTLTWFTHLVFRVGRPDWDRVKREARARRANGNTIFSPAYKVRCDAGVDKVEYVVDRCLGGLAQAGTKPDTDSMQETHRRVAAVRGFGSFMAGQVVADLRHAVPGRWSDRHAWAPLGPGSVRGINRILGPSPGRTVTEMMQVIDDVRLALPREVSGRLEAMDYQNCLCEFDKYERALWGEGRPKQLYRAG